MKTLKEDLLIFIIFIEVILIICGISYNSKNTLVPDDLTTKVAQCDLVGGVAAFSLVVGTGKESGQSVLKWTCVIPQKIVDTF